MKDFQLINDTKLLFRNNPAADLAALSAGKKVLFVYGGGSAKENGCYDDVKKQWRVLKEPSMNWAERPENWQRLRTVSGWSGLIVLSWLSVPAEPTSWTAPSWSLWAAVTRRIYGTMLRERKILTDFISCL